MYFESHAHYDDKQFDDDREAVIEGLIESGIDHVINVGCDMNSSKMSIEMAKKHEFMYCAVGVHPHGVSDMSESDIIQLKEYSKEEKVVAVGEIGLDYYYDYAPREKQRYWFERQMELSLEVDLPVIIHSREATEETFEIVKKSGVRKGVVHCYLGSLETARAYAELGFSIGIGGVVTYKNAKNLLNVVEHMPISRILIETDAPYLSPEPKRGKRNNSKYLKYVTEKIALIKEMTPKEVAEATSENAKLLFFQQ